MDWTFIKPSTVWPRFLPHHAYATYYSIVQWWAKQRYYARSCNKRTITTELQLNLQKHISICCCSFNKISMKRKTSAARKFWPDDKFWPNDKFWLFWPNNLGFPRGISVKFGLWTFRELSKRQKNFDFIDFWLP